MCGKIKVQPLSRPRVERVRKSKQMLSFNWGMLAHPCRLLPVGSQLKGLPQIQGKPGPNPEVFHRSDRVDGMSSCRDGGEGIYF